MKISKKYNNIAEAYRYFCGNLNADFSESAMKDMYSYETFGHPKIKYDQLYNGNYNGFAVGKHWMDVTISMWLEDLKSGNLTKYELYSDASIPEFVKNIVNKLYI